MKKVVVAGIGTNVGKTVISAILCESLGADYWKPVQAGLVPATDTQSVKDLISNTSTVLFPESYSLTSPMSPHAAASIDGVHISLEKLQLPESDKLLVVEPAGGLMVPLNEDILVADLIRRWNAPVILVSRNYLGSINHTLLSVHLLRSYSIRLLGIVFNGEPNQQSESYILNYTGATCLGRLPNLDEVNRQTVKKYAEEWHETLKTAIDNDTE